MSDDPQDAYEQALIDCANARDGNGNHVLLLPRGGVPTSDQMREATRNFMGGMADEHAVFLSLDGGTLKSSPQAEIAAWANLGLLARATAAAIRAGR